MSLHKAVLKGDFLEVRRLVESGVEVNGRDAGGRTALMLCCLHDGEDRARGVARTLLMHGGRVGLSDGSGRSALIYAVLYERVGLVRMFLQALDYDLTARDRTGRTALDYANQTRNQTIIDLVLQVMRRYGLTSQNSCSQNPQPADQRVQEPQEPQHQPAPKAAEVPSGEKSSPPVPNTQPGPYGVFTNPLPYKNLSEKKRMSQETIESTRDPKKHQGPQTVSKSTSSKMETESEKKGEERFPPVQNPKPGQYDIFTNPLPYKNLSEKKRMSQETIRRTQGPKRQPASKDAPKKVYSKKETESEKKGEESFPPGQNPEPGPNGVFTNPLPHRTLSKKLWTIKRKVHQRKHQGPRTVSKSTSSKMETESEKKGEERFPPVQNPKPGQYGVFTNPLPYRTLSKKLWKIQEPSQRTLGVQHQPNPKVMSKVQGFPHIQNQERGQETVQEKLEPKHQPASRGASKVVLDESSLPVQNLLPMKTTLKNINRDSVQRNLAPKDLQRSEKANERTTHVRSPPLRPRNWRQDFRVLMEILQLQNSPSYRPKAQPLPPAPRPRRRRFPGAERSPVLGRKKKSRKMSLGALDESLEVEKMMRTYRRRCTLAAIPVIQPTKGRSTRVTGQENFRVGGERKPSKTAGEIKVSKKK